jgi:hypothetical protein
MNIVQAHLSALKLMRMITSSKIVAETGSQTINLCRDGERVINLVRSPRSVDGLKLAPIVTQLLQLQRAYNLCTREAPEQTLHKAAGGTSSTQGMTA